MAERVAEFTPDAHQVPFFRREIERLGQPVLDIGRGVGRLLLTLLCAGVDIDGCDIWGDMLRPCRDKAVSQGLDPQTGVEGQGDRFLDQAQEVAAEEV